ncbi:MAG TPA: glycerol-3-phosphate dehydrogenase C-terminal domain-containing protein, partial [Acetobacteraceae bacterium]|nr:glycerol-3-phosphate dehydrogenase C-terminal domain-containing protein [Acetobacteraceae bacterium]
RNTATTRARMQIATPAVAERPRAFVRVAGPDAADLLQRMVSNDVEALRVGDSCEALLLTAKARVIAPMRVWRRGEDDFLLLTEPELGETLRSALLRVRFASKCEIEPEEHRSTLVLGGGEGIANEEYGVPAVEVLDAEVAGEPIDADELERLRILARTPRFGRELDDRVLPAEAGLDERAISFSKGCYPGQEPVARLHFRGKANRTLRVLELDGEPPLLTAFGGKITTFRRLGEAALALLAPFFPDLPGPWTAGAPLPGGDFPWDGQGALRAELQRRFPFLTEPTVRRLVRSYGTLAVEMLGDARSTRDLGDRFGADLTEREVDWLVRTEWARTADDVLWRRSKLGLHLGPCEVAHLGAWLGRRSNPGPATSPAGEITTLADPAHPAGRHRPG